MPTKPCWQVERLTGPRRMCATLTLVATTAVADQASEWLVCNVGDSPAWMVGETGAVRVSQDQNIAADLLRAGSITAAAAKQHPGRHVVTQAIGVRPHVVPSMRQVVLRPGDALVVASDGLSELPDDVVEILTGPGSSEEMPPAGSSGSPSRTGLPTTSRRQYVRHLG